MCNAPISTKITKMKLNNMKILVALTCVTAVSFMYMLYIQIPDPLIIANTEKLQTANTGIEQPQGETEVNNATKTSSELKYILQWTNPNSSPFLYMGKGQEVFIDMNCSYTNCYVTADRNFMDGDYTKFDVIAFAGPELVRYPKSKLPDKRSPHQKYVMATIESAANYPVCNEYYDGFFNWTWTYRLDSDSRWGFVVVRDSNGKLIGPHKQMSWKQLKDMDPVSEELKTKLKSKTKAASWLVSNCRTKNKREDFVAKLQTELAKYNLHVDIYGKCGPLKCPPKTHKDCMKKIEKDYYFYLAFENSFDEDYVTEKLTRALQHDAVPIVYGGANYSSFMPDGMYLHARELGVEALARKMHELINNPEEYYEYFRWKSHYSFYRRIHSIETNHYCSFCERLNNKEAMERKTVYENFRDWWNPSGSCFP